MTDGIPEMRLRYSTTSKQFEAVEHASTKPFLKGPISMDWLSRAAQLPGKALHVAVAIQYLAGMNKGKPFKLTAKALAMVGVSDDATGDGLKRLEAAGLIHVARMQGQRADIRVLGA